MEDPFSSNNQYDTISRHPVGFYAPFFGTMAHLNSGIFLPVMLVTLPLPTSIMAYFPNDIVIYSQWFAFWTFSALLVIPWLFCVYQLVTNSVGRRKQIRDALDDRTAPKTVIVMPVYKEHPDVLITAVDSVVDCDYPSNCIHVFLSYDGDEVDEPYLKVISYLGVPITLTTYPSSIDVTYKGARITISRFRHGGKRQCQKQTFKLIDKIYQTYLEKNDNLFILFIDSDCILDRVCLQNFMYDMELKPGAGKMLAMTGIITSTTKRHSLITILQDLEYIHGQLFERSVESGCGAVTCLPGALTVLRFSAFKKMSKYYFADKTEECVDLFDYAKCHLGEDRWLTHLFMIGAKEAYQIQLCTNAFCKTEAVQTFHSLLKQRRRWFLGFITNEACMLTDIRIWRRYPMLCLTRLMQNTIRTTALLFFIMVVSLLTTSNTIDNLPVGFIAVSLGLNYLIMLYFGVKLGRFKAWLYPLMFILNPFFNWTYMIYGIFTAGRRTWGGPRADAAKAEKAATQAEQAGEEFKLEIDPFKCEKKAHVPVHPSDELVGRFAPPEMSGDSYYNHPYSSPYSINPESSHSPHVISNPVHPPDPWDTDGEVSLSGTSIILPRNVDSIMIEQGRSRSSDSRKSSVSSLGCQSDGSSSPCEISPARSPIRRSRTNPGVVSASSRDILSRPHRSFSTEQRYIESRRFRTASIERSPLGRTSPARQQRSPSPDKPVKPEPVHQRTTQVPEDIEIHGTYDLGLSRGRSRYRWPFAKGHPKSKDPLDPARMV